MASQRLIQALRAKFGSEDTSVRLSELLIFLETLQNTNAPVKTAKTKNQSPQSSQSSQRDAHAHVTRANNTPARPSSTTATHPTSASTSANHSPSPSPTTAISTSPDEIPRPPQRPSYADIAKSTPEKAPQPRKPRKALALPESVKLAPKTPSPLKIALREPIKDLPCELILKIKDRAVNGERLASLIKAFRILTPKSLLVYTATEAAREELSQNTSWLDAIHASFYTRYYSIVIYRIRRDTPTQDILERIREQNSILQESLASVNWLGKEKGPLGTLRINITDPTVANRAILRGITLDYEFKKVCQYTPRKREPIEQRERLFYKEKAPKSLSRVIFSASKEISKPQAQEDDWVLVEGTQKRRQIVPRGRGRPKAFERIDNSHGNIDKFVVPATQEPLTVIPETQIPTVSSQGPSESMNVD